MRITDLDPDRLGDFGSIRITRDAETGQFRAEVWWGPYDAEDGLEADGFALGPTMEEVISAAFADLMNNAE